MILTRFGFSTYVIVLELVCIYSKSLRYFKKIDNSFFYRKILC